MKNLSNWSFYMILIVCFLLIFSSHRPIVTADISYTKTIETPPVCCILTEWLDAHFVPKEELYPQWPYSQDMVYCYDDRYQDYLACVQRSRDNFENLIRLYCTDPRCDVGAYLCSCMEEAWLLDYKRLDQCYKTYLSNIKNCLSSANP